MSAYGLCSHRRLPQDPHALAQAVKHVNTHPLNTARCMLSSMSVLAWPSKNVSRNLGYKPCLQKLNWRFTHLKSML